MTTRAAENDLAPRTSVYGPVRSWRFGRSLGIDLILETSTCSFNCIYCQLGRIQQVTMQQGIFVTTAQVLAELDNVQWEEVDVVTISGSGEPTLALNLGEVIAAIRQRYAKPVTVLTNATLLQDPATRQQLRLATRVACKLDAPDDELLRRFNRPAEGVSIRGIVEGIKALKAEGFPTVIAIQSMFMAFNRDRAAEIAALIREIGPDEIHLNTPRRPYPRQWHRSSRGNHEGEKPVESVALQTITQEEADEIERIMRAANPVTRILSVYEDGQ